MSPAPPGAASDGQRAAERPAEPQAEPGGQAAECTPPPPKRCLAEAGDSGSAAKRRASGTFALSPWAPAAAAEDAAINLTQDGRQPPSSGAVQLQQEQPSPGPHLPLQPSGCTGEGQQEEQPDPVLAAWVAEVEELVQSLCEERAATQRQHAQELAAARRQHAQELAATRQQHAQELAAAQRQHAQELGVAKEEAAK